MKKQLVKNGNPILDLEDWRVRAGPKREIQWKDGRSAKESARSWLAADGVPPEIFNLIADHPDFGEIEEWVAEPEAPVRIDDFKGEPPNIDVLLCAKDAMGPMVVVVEAKADESFGVTIEETRINATRRFAESPNSKGLARLDRLSEAIAGRASDNPEIASLRYQLFTATGAALAEANRRGADRAVVLVHEFISDETALEKRQRNQEDFSAFLRLFGESTRTGGSLVGPVHVPGVPIVESAAKLYFGKASVDVSSGNTTGK